jgi:hypothetical protein
MFAAAAVMASLLLGAGALPVSAQTPGESPGIPPAPVWPPPSEAPEADSGLEVPTAYPLLMIDDKTYDAGTVWQGEMVEATFMIRNEGQENLTLEVFRKSCGCTAVLIPNKLIPPGTQSPVTLKVNTSGKRKRFTVNATLKTNDPLTPELKLVVTGIATPYISIEPQQSVIFGRITEGTQQSRELTLTGNLDEPLQIVEVRLDKPHFTHKLETIEDGKSYKLTVSTNPPLKKGSNTARLVVVTSYESVPNVDIKCSAYVPERLSLKPAQLTLSNPVHYGDVQRVVYVHDEGERKAAVISTRTTSEDIKVDYEPLPTGRGYKVTLNFTAGMEIPQQGHAVFVETDDPDPDYRVLQTKILPRRTPQPRQARAVTPTAAPRKPAAAPARPQPAATPTIPPAPNTGSSGS